MGEGDHTCLENADGGRHLVTVGEQKMSGGKEERDSAQGSVDLEEEIGRVAEGGELEHDKGYELEGRKE